ncbi:MAG TPA: YraN family protein [Planctomycetota bacterium]|nr:YraN family protein [Planctomycetota bacterium]
MEERGRLGRRGEEAAARALEAKGWRILGRNLRTRLGEVDLLAFDGETLVAVEVKTRSGEAFGRPEEAVDARRIGRLRRAALALAAARGLGERPIRIDVVAVRRSGGGRLDCEHIPDVGS